MCNDISPFDPSRGALSASCTSGICRLEVLLADFDGLINGISSAGFSCCECFLAVSACTENKRVEELLSNEDLQSALVDSYVQSFISLLKKDPKKAHRLAVLFYSL